MPDPILVIAIMALQASRALPPYLDAVAAAPGNHQVLLENDQVRVLQVTVAPGETEAVHEHRWPSVIHIQSWQPAEDVTYRVQDGRLVETARHMLPAGPPPAAIWSPREEPHAITNLGRQPFRLLRVEIKQAATPPG